MRNHLPPDRLVFLPNELSMERVHEGLLSYMLERHSIWKRRFEQGLDHPWTKDAILRTFKFTNVYRELDRTTQSLIPIYRNHRDRPLSVILMNAATFRYFGTTEMAHAIGWQERAVPHQTLDTADIAWSLHPLLNIDRIQSIVRRRKSLGLKVFTGAYVITNSGRTEPKEVVVCDYLQGLRGDVEAVATFMKETDSWEQTCTRMSLLPGFGGSGFMAKEILLDVMLAGWKPIDASTWTPVGPGARRGLNRVFCRDLNAPIRAEQMQKEITRLRERIALDWPSDWKKLTQHDIQFSLCEYDKYCRVAFGEGRPRSVYTARKEERK